MSGVTQIVASINVTIWADWTLYVLLGAALLFTLWSRFSQWRALTHGVARLRSSDEAPGTLHPFQALCLALGGTTGVGSIAGAAIAVTLGGPGAVFWMWIVAFVAMALKFTEVTLSMLHRDLEDPNATRGGPMWVAATGFDEWTPGWQQLGRFLGAVFCVALLVVTFAGIGFFEVWNVAGITESYFGVAPLATAGVLTIVVAIVLFGGTHRLGVVIGSLVPFAFVLYVLCGLGVLVARADRLPGVLAMIFESAFSAREAGGAFLGASTGYAFLFGTQRAFYSSLTGQGASPIAHSAARTNEPVRQGLIASLEPLLDTALIGTFSALVILVSGVWNRPPDATYFGPLQLRGSIATGDWTLPNTTPPTLAQGKWREGQRVIMQIHGSANAATGNDRHPLEGVVIADPDGTLEIDWDYASSRTVAEITEGEVWFDYDGATLTARAFDVAWNGAGKWIITIVCWLFAGSALIAWGYYGEQAVVYLFGAIAAIPYRLLMLAVMLAAGARLVATVEDVAAWSTLGAGMMLWINVPLTLLLSAQAMRACRDYLRRRDHGKRAASSA